MSTSTSTSLADPAAAFLYHCKDTTTPTSDQADTTLETLLSLSNRVFGIDPINPTRHSSYQYWHQQLSLPSSNIIYAAATTNKPNNHENQQQQQQTPPPPSPLPLGFFFNIPRTHPELSFETMHIWLAAVDESAQSRGVFRELMQRTTEHAQSLEFEWLTVCTVPTRFRRMYHVLQTNGWEFVAHRDDGEKVLMKLKI